MKPILLTSIEAKIISHLLTMPTVIKTITQDEAGREVYIDLLSKIQEAE